MSTFWQIFTCITGLSLLYFVGLLGVVYQSIPAMEIFIVLAITVIGVFSRWAYKQFRGLAKEFKDDN